MFVSASHDFQIHSIAENGIENFQLEGENRTRISSVSICNDNTFLALLRENEKPQIYSIKDLENLRLIHVINVANVTTLTFKHHTKKIIALGTKFGEVIIYDTKARTVANVFPKITESIKVLEFSCDDEKLAGVDGKILFVFPEINSSNTLRKYRLGDTCTALKCHNFLGNRAAVGFQNGEVSLWDLNKGVEIISVSVLRSPVEKVAMSSCGNFLVAAGSELRIAKLDFQAGGVSFLYTLPVEGISSMALSGTDRFLAVGLEDGSMKVYDVEKQLKEVYLLKRHSATINCLVFENEAMEENQRFGSVLQLPSDLLKKCEPLESCLKKRSSKSVKDESLEKMRKSLLKMFKSELDALETQMQEHCVKFQKFLDKEFETIDDIIKKKWDVFNVGDINQIMTAICPEDATNGSNCR